MYTVKPVSWSFTVWRDSFTSSVSLDSRRPQCFAGDEVTPIVSEPSSSFILTASFSSWQSGEDLSRLDPLSMMYWSLSLPWGSSFLSVNGPCNKNACGLYNEDSGGSCDEDACRLCSEDACGSCIEDTCRSCNEDVCMWIRFELNGVMWVSQFSDGIKHFLKAGQSLPRLSWSNSIHVRSALDVPVNASAIDSILFTVLPLPGTKFVSIDYIPIVELLEFWWPL